MRGWPELTGTEEKPPPWVSGSQRSWSRLAERRRGCCVEKATCGPLPISQESHGHGASPHTRPEPRAPAVSGRGAQLLPRPARTPGTPSLHKWASQPAPTSRPLGGERAVWAVHLGTSTRAPRKGSLPSPLLPPPSLPPGASLGTSEAISSHHSNCPTHQ